MDLSAFIFFRGAVIKRYLIIALLGFVTLSVSCKSTELETSESAPAFSLVDSQETDVKGNIISEIESYEDGESAEKTIDSAGYCKDDIYTKYLANQFKKENKSKSKNYKSKRSRRKYNKNRESQALHYAASRLKGPTSIQFGSFPVAMNQRVEFWMRYFKTTGRRTFLKWIVRGESIKGIIAPILKNEGVPPELYYLAMVESGFNNKAYSSAAATGTWQFMKGTAKLYDLKIDYWVDERRDPAKATVAAARLLKDLYERFGDWHLALAGYNAGPGRVSKAIRRARSRSFWKIADGNFLSKETRNYVPKMIAALTLATNSKHHGFDMNADPGENLPSTAIFIDRPIRLKDLSKSLNVSLSDLKKWNPELTRGITPPKRLWKGAPGYQLRLPKHLAQLYTKIEPQLAYLEIKDILIHRIRNGDTLYGIARKYKVSVRKILRVNPKLSPKRLRIGKRVAIPIPAVVTRKKSIG